jgi:hypothetical protein
MSSLVDFFLRSTNENPRKEEIETLNKKGLVEDGKPQRRQLGHLHGVSLCSRISEGKTFC